jgi:hypothetical protein
MKNLNILLSLMLFLVIQNAMSQPFSLDPKIKPQEIKLLDYKKGDSIMSGRLGSAKVSQDKDTLYFFVKGPGIYQTVGVGIGNKKPNQTLDIALCKDSWTKPNRVSKILAKPYYEKFRTEGSFGIRVITKQRKSDYGIVVWLSDEPKKIKMPNAFQAKVSKSSKK